MFGKGVGDAALRAMLAETVEAAVVVQDERIASCNAVAEGLSGFPEAELKTLPYSVLIAPEDQKRAAQEVARRIAGQPAERRPVYRMRRKAGGVYWAEVQGFRIAWQGRAAVLMFWRETTQRIRSDDRKTPMPGLLDPMGRDPLTGLFDHESYVEELERVDEEANLPITLFLAEVEGLDDTIRNFGEKAGEELVKTFAGFLRKETRAGDFIARLDRNRFAILLKRTDAWMAEGIQRRIDDDLANRDRSLPPFTASFGMGTKTAKADSFGPVFQEALKKLERYRRMTR